jgi:hypothetical protein
VSTRKPTPEALAEIRRISERRLTAEEFDAYVRAPMSDREREDFFALVDWFCARYPTPAARLAQARRWYPGRDR